MTDVTWRDGAEGRVGVVVGAAADRSSLSDELALAATDQVERYHLAASRANVLRALALPAGAQVLEIGAGCGAATRYLGETVRSVDAWEPDAVRAGIARERVADLANVAVRVGGLDDIEPGDHDVVVAIGVLEYVAAERGLAAAVGAMAALVPEGGHLVVAIENRLGVKYLSGSPEDHLGAPLAGIEGYLAGGHARTFGRGELTAAARAAGLQARVLAAMPDYKHARVVFGDELVDDQRARHLAVTVPPFPSPDIGGERIAGPDERALWRQVVGAGLGGWLANSFVVVARRGGAPNLWPPGRLAAAYTTDRRARFATETVFRRAGDGVGIERRRLAGDDLVVPAGTGLRFDARPHRWMDGRDLLEVLVEAPREERRRLLRAWRSAVEARPTGGGTSLDAIPRNCVVGADGSVAVIDEEWWSDEASVGDVVRRGLLLTALELAGRAPVEVLGVPTAAALADQLASDVGLSPPSGWIDDAVEAEAALLARNELLDPVRTAAHARGHAASLRAGLALPLAEGSLGTARFVTPARLAELVRHEQEGAALRGELAVQSARAAELGEAFDASTTRLGAALGELTAASEALEAASAELARLGDVERRLREQEDAAVALADEVDHLRLAVEASAELVADEAARADELRRRLADVDMAALTAAAEELSALKATKLLRWSDRARGAYARLLRFRRP